ncbi:MAG: transcriptional regulator [Pseudomonadota bacterium]
MLNISCTHNDYLVFNGTWTREHLGHIMIFIEMSKFTSLLDKYLNDEEYRQLQNYLLENPKAGAILRGSRGIRKLRWAARGKGKSGGVIIIYYWAEQPEHIYLLTLYSKGEQENIDAATLKRIVKLLETLK